MLQSLKNVVLCHQSLLFVLQYIRFKVRHIKRLLTNLFDSFVKLSYEKLTDC